MLLISLVGVAIIYWPRADEVLIDPPELLPTEMVKSGWTATGLANRFGGAINAINTAAGTRHARLTYLPPSQIPQYDLSKEQGIVAKAVIILHDVFVGPNRRFILELTRIDPDQIISECSGAISSLSKQEYQLHVHLVPSSESHIECGGSVATVVTDGAEWAVKRTNPFVLAAYYYSLGDREKARDVARDIRSGGAPNEVPWALNLLGIILMDDGLLEEAIGSFGEALAEADKTGLTFWPAYASRGNAYLEASDYQKALENYKEAIRLEPQEAGPYVGIGITYLFLNDFELAINSIDTAIRLNPVLAEAYFARGLVAFQEGLRLERMGQINSAFKFYADSAFDFRKAVNLDPDYADAHYYLGNAYYRQHLYEDSLLAFDASIEIQPHFVEAYGGRGLVYLAIGARYEKSGDLMKAIPNWEAAADEFDKVLERRANDANAYFFRGKARQHVGEYESAEKDFETSLSLGPDSPDSVRAWLRCSRDKDSSCGSS